MPRGIKKTVKRVVKRRVKQATTPKDNPMLAALESIAARPNPVHEESGDARASVLEALAQVLVTQNEAINNIAAASIGAPNYVNSLKRG